MKSVTYTVVASSDKELKECFYEVKGSEVRVPYTEKNPTTVKEMKANITVADTATVSVLNGGAELADSDAVADGMTLRITAEDGTTNDFAIKQKNEYNWTFDFVRGQQGNVWFGQIKDSSSDWANMTTIDSDGWPNWATHTYYGPGIDAPRTQIQQLIQQFMVCFPHRQKQIFLQQWHIEHRRAEQYHSRSKMTSHISVSLRTQTEQSP